MAHIESIKHLRPSNDGDIVLASENRCALTIDSMYPKMRKIALTGGVGMGIRKRLAARAIAAVRGGDCAARYLGLTVGTDCRILSLETGSEPWLISIGNRVTVSGGVQFLTHDGAGWLYHDESGRRFRYSAIEIGDDVFVGNRSIIMPGVRIGNRCIIGAGSIVTRSVETGSVVAGNPARRITSYDELMGRVASWPSSRDLQGLGHHERVEKALMKINAADTALEDQCEG